MKNISFFKKHSSKSWFIQYTDEHGTRKQLSTRSNLKADALRFLHEHKAELSERKAKPKTLSSFTTDFLLYAESQYRTGTVDLYRLALASFMESVGNIPMEAVTVRQVDTWKAAMTEKKSARGELFSVVSVNVYFRSLKAAFNTAARWGLVKVNPFLSSKVLPTSGKKPAFLTIEDFNNLISNIPEGELRDFVIFGINTGARRGEILSMKWDAIDFERRFFVIRNTDSFKTKTGRERAVPLSDAALSVLYRRKNTAAGEYVFQDQGAPILGNTITHTFKKAARRAGLSEGIHVHSLRHSCASLLMQSGANITAVKEILGHSTISTTQIYLHNTSDSLRHELEKIPSLQ